jgi:hypothetical protein
MSLEQEERATGPTLWATDRHQFGPGKVHIVDGAHRTMCGKWLHALPGREIRGGQATCKNCLNAAENRVYRERERAQWEQEREEADREWWATYAGYLRTREWMERREKVLKRANYVCEGCLCRPATEVHHVTYDHVFHEPCFELRAMCHECHEALTAMDRERKERPPC